jgi:hypothetical protein
VRKTLMIGTSVGVLALAFAAIALATGTKQSFTAKFGATKPGRATTVAVDLHSTDPTNTAHNNAPDPARKVVLGFPKGAAIDPAGAPQCSATSNDFSSKGTSACPSGTVIATGTASANSTFPTVGEINATVTGFNGKSKKIIFYVQPSPGAPAQPFTITGQLSGSKTKGFKLTTTPPPNCIPPGTPANGCASGEAPLDKFKVTLKNKKSGKHTFLKTPTKCPKSKNWTFSATITFKTDGTKSYKSNSPCKS